MSQRNDCAAAKIAAKILYEGQAPDTQALVFLRPYARTDGTEFVHVIAFESMNWR